MKTLFLGLSAVFLLAASTPAGASHYGAGYSAVAGPITIGPTATTVAITHTFVIGRRAASYAE